jgi:uncharacterized membrane protein
MPEKSPISKLVDTIFGFALAIGALSLTGTRPQSISEVLGGLFLFGLSFVILIVIWWDHSDLMSKLPGGGPKIVVLNTVLMFFVAVEPYLLNTLSTSIALFEFASIMYAVDMTFLMGISAVLAHILVSEYGTALSTAQMRTYRVSRNFQIVLACMFLLSALPQFFAWTFMGTPVRIYLWLATLVLSIGARDRKKGKEEG